MAVVAAPVKAHPSKASAVRKKAQERASKSHKLARRKVPVEEEEEEEEEGDNNDGEVASDDAEGSHDEGESEEEEDTDIEEPSARRGKVRSRLISRPKGKMGKDWKLAETLGYDKSTLAGTKKWNFLRVHTFTLSLSVLC
jgi:hypothetical protein